MVLQNLEHGICDAAQGNAASARVARLKNGAQGPINILHVSPVRPLKGVK